MQKTFFASFFAAITLIAGTAFAKDPVYTGRFSNLAVDGYDVVAYFSQGAPTKGDSQYTFDYQGAEWRFANAANRDAFAADPDAYAPQYGGYCAWAVSQGYTARGNPKNWTIHEDKLYLNYNSAVQENWRKDIPGNITLANANWPDVLDN